MTFPCAFCPNILEGDLTARPFPALFCSDCWIPNEGFREGKEPDRLTLENLASRDPQGDLYVALVGCVVRMLFF